MPGWPVGHGRLFEDAQPGRRNWDGYASDSSPTAPAALPAIAISCDAAGILTAGGTVEGVARSTLTPLPLCAVAETPQIATGIIPLVNPPPAALAAPQVIAVNLDAAGILTAGGIVEGVVQRAFTPSPLRAAAETAQMAAADTVAHAGRAPPAALAAPQGLPSSKMLLAF
jgi:hypothetical protein